MKVKTSELIGPALDWAVAKCDGVECDENHTPIWFESNGLAAPRVSYSPSTDWAQGGPIIYRGDISVLPPTVRRIGAERHAFPVDYWRAMVREDENENAIHGKGPTPLIAAMRCYVATKLGDEVDVPEELA